jgi:hypothetical protein
VDFGWHDAEWEARFAAPAAGASGVTRHLRDRVQQPLVIAALVTFGVMMHW